MVTPKLKTHYCVAVSQTISTDKKFLFVGTNFGNVFLFSLQQLQDFSTQGFGESEATLESNLPLQVIQVGESQIYSLAYFNDFLIVGTNAEILGFAFNKGQIGKQTWCIRIPSTPENAEMNEVNFMWMDTDNGHLYAGCGDANIYGISLNDGKILRTYAGHADYIHSLDGNVANNQIVSASEDGTVKFWDMRQKKATRKIEPHKKEQLERKNFGKWLGTVSLTDDWLVCGGGPRFGLWHLRSNEVTQVFDFPGKVHVSAFIEDLIVVGGEHQKLNQYNFNGDLVAEVPVSSSSIYSLTYASNPTKFLTLGGASNFIDFCTNFNFRDYALKLYK